MKTLKLLNYERDRWIARRRQSRGNPERDRWHAGGDDRIGRARFRRDASSRARSRRPGAAQADVSRARADAQGARPRDHGAQGGAVRAQLLDRRDAQGRLDRHRGRRGNALLLFVEGPARASRRACAARRTARGPVEERDVRRPAHLHAAAGRGGAYQRVQFPRLGNAGKARADACSQAFRRS